MTILPKSQCDFVNITSEIDMIKLSKTVDENEARDGKTPESLTTIKMDEIIGPCMSNNDTESSEKENATDQAGMLPGASLDDDQENIQKMHTAIEKAILDASRSECQPG